MSARTLGSRIGILLLALAALLLPPNGHGLSRCPPGCPGALGTADIIRHDFSVSFCELCDVGTVRIVIQNPFQPWNRVDFSEIVVSEDLMDSGLTYVEDTTDASPAATSRCRPSWSPRQSGPGDSILTWTCAPANSSWRRNPAGRHRAIRATLIIEFDVRG